MDNSPRNIPKRRDSGVDKSTADSGSAPGNLRHSSQVDRPGFVRQAFDFILVVIVTLAVLGILNNWIVQRYYIPSGSMESTIMPHDYVLTSKLVPDTVEINRGDVVVFNDSGHWLGEHDASKPNWLQKALIWGGLRPDPDQQQLIKRVIGLPGDEVTCCNASGQIEVNGIPISEPYLKSGVVPSLSDFRVIVPADRFWVMGDNRSNSADSRAHQDKPGDGTIPRSDILGKAIAVVWPLSRVQWLSDQSQVFSSVPVGSSKP